jgi:hypothetical protein
MTIDEVVGVDDLASEDTRVGAGDGITVGAVIGGVFKVGLDDKV